MGRWDGEYDDGKSPGTWNHSGKMLEEWRDNDMAPVKYGQCWVFSGLLTTGNYKIPLKALKPQPNHVNMSVFQSCEQSAFLRVP